MDDKIASNGDVVNRSLGRKGKNSQKPLNKNLQKSPSKEEKQTHSPLKKRKRPIVAETPQVSEQISKKKTKKEKKSPKKSKVSVVDNDKVKEDGLASKPEETKKEETTKNAPEEAVKDVFRNKEKVLVVSSRGITFRYRHLMEDLMLLLPHSKKDAKMENSKENRAVLLNEMADLKGCSSCVFFEGRKRKDLYMWISKTPNGPSAKFLVNAVHTMAELKLSGNHLKGSRPILTFSPSFDKIPHLQLLKEIFSQVLVTPKDHRKVKPFFDHVTSLTFVDNHIWFRNYQITVPNPAATKIDPKMLEKMTLVEVGPRFCLNPIKVFSGSFGGVTLYDNPLYVSPNAVRSQEKRAKAGKYTSKVKAKQRRRQHLVVNPAQEDEFADVWRE